MQHDREQRLLLTFRDGNGYFHLGQSAAESAYRLEGAFGHQTDFTVLQSCG